VIKRVETQGSTWYCLVFSTLSKEFIASEEEINKKIVIKYYLGEAGQWHNGFCYCKARL